MTIDEAIEHAGEKAEELKNEAINCQKDSCRRCETDCIECAEEHKQLAEWLEELKRLRLGVNYLNEKAYQQGRADAIDEFLIKAKKIIRHEVKNAYNHGNVEFNKFAILEKGKTILSEEPFEISANYIIDLLETIKKQLKEQTNE